MSSEIHRDLIAIYRIVISYTEMKIRFTKQAHVFSGYKSLFVRPGHICDLNWQNYLFHAETPSGFFLLLHSLEQFQTFMYLYVSFSTVKSFFCIPLSFIPITRQSQSISPSVSPKLQFSVSVLSSCSNIWSLSFQNTLILDLISPLTKKLIDSYSWFCLQQFCLPQKAAPGIQHTHSILQTLVQSGH